MINNKLHNQQTATKAVILSRVSSKDQEDGKSLGAQLELCRNYADSKGLQVIAQHSIVESSTRGDRTKFNQIIDFIKSQKEPIALICHTIDRFQRNFKESVLAEPLILNGTLELHFINSNLVINQDNYFDKALIWDVNVMGARAYINQIKINTRRGLDKKIADGELPSKAPLGYLNVEVDNKKTIIVDPATAPLVKQIFTKYATGTYSVYKAAEDLRKANVISSRGTHVSVSTIHRILQNPFYYGEMIVRGEQRPHKYPPLIDKKTFLACQTVRENLNKKHTHYATKDFTFRGLVQCECCGRIFSSYDRVKRNKGNGKEHHYTYLKCSGKANHKAGPRCQSIEFREEELLKQVEQALQGLNTDKEALSYSVKELTRSLEDNIKTMELTKTNLTKRLEAITKEREVWISKEASGLLAADKVNEKLKALNIEENELKQDLSKQVQISSKNVWTLQRAVNLMKRLPKLFAGSQPGQKRKLLQLVFANLSVSGKNLHFSYQKPFSLLAKGAKCIVMGG